MYPAESYFWTIDAEKPGNRRTVKMESCMAFVWKWQWQWFPGPYEPEFVLTPSTTTTLLVPFFFPWLLILLQNFSAEACASNTICWLNVAQARGAGKGRGADSPLCSHFFGPSSSCPAWVSVPGAAVSQPQGAAEAGGGSKSLSQPPKPEICSVTPVSHLF